MLSRKNVILDIFNKHGKDAVYITSTGYISRACHSLLKDYNNIFYMNGSMGLAPAIALGIALNTNKDVIALSGDASFLMHLGITHTIRDCNLSNLYHYVLDNGCHESVGGYECSSLKEKYTGVNKIIKINCEGKAPRVDITFEENAKNIIKFLGNKK